MVLYGGRGGIGAAPIEMTHPLGWPALTVKLWHLDRGATAKAGLCSALNRILAHLVVKMWPDL
jgi:hypothetical protein